MHNSALSWALAWADVEHPDNMEMVTGDGRPLKPIPTPESVGCASIEIVNLNIGAFLGRGLHHFRPEYRDKFYSPFENVQVELDEPTIMVQSVSKGRVSILDRVASRNVALNGGTSYFGLGDHIEYGSTIGHTDRAEVMVLTVGLSTLAELVGEKLSRSLVTTLGLHGTQSAQGVALPRRISNVLHQGISAAFNNDLRGLFAQAKVLEYFTLLIGYVSDEAEAALSPGKRKIVQLREELESLDGEFPRLNDLAARYGMSARSLNDCFRQMYGQTIGSFAMHRKLELARVALRQTDVPIKVLAARLGYSHVNHFSAAFAREFGYPPSDLRR